MKITPAMNNYRGLTTHRSCVLLTIDWVSPFWSIFWLQETRVFFTVKPRGSPYGVIFINI
jgi:hypothetical protein